MSIRPKEAADHATRFSLREAILGANAPGRTAQHPVVHAVGYATPLAGHGVAFAAPSSGGVSFSATHGRTHINQPPVQPQMPIAVGAANNNGRNRVGNLTFKNMFADASTEFAWANAAAMNSRASEADNARKASRPEAAVSATAAAALERIKSIQSSQRTGNTDSTAKFVLKQALNGATGQRMLPSGYVSGGRIGTTDAHSEIMRLNGIVDSLNNELKAKLQRLERTETSLSKANKQIVNERALFQSKLDRATDHVRKLTESESKLKAVAKMHRTDQQKSDVSFKQSVLKFDASEAKIRAQADEIESTKRSLSETSTALELVTSERDSCLARVDTLETKERDLETRLGAAEVAASTTAAMDQGKEDTAATMATLRASESRLTKEVEGLGAECDRLRAETQASAQQVLDNQRALSDERDATSLAMASAISERDEATLQMTALRLEIASITEDRDGLCDKLNTAEKQLATAGAARDDAVFKLSLIPSNPKPSSKGPAIDAKRLMADLKTTRAELYKSNNSRSKTEHKLDLLMTQMRGSVVGKSILKEMRVLFDEFAQESIDAHCASIEHPRVGGATLLHASRRAPVHARSVRSERAERLLSGEATSFGLKCCAADNPTSQHHVMDCTGHAFGRKQPGSMLMKSAVSIAGSTVACGEGAQKAPQNYEKLVVAVSKDVVSAVVDARRNFMLASGMKKIDVDRQLKEFVVSPIGDDEESGSVS
jgi:hypothetical protein